MSMIIDEEKKTLRFDVPNSEANINAQHCGIKDRTVGAYYMSADFELCASFLSNFQGDFYIDLPLSIRNAGLILKLLKEKGYQKAFKYELVPQFNALKALEWSLSEANDYFYKMETPTVNEQQKYLKFDNEDTVINLFKTLILGDLTSIYIKKCGNNGFIIYLDKCPKFDDLINQNAVLKWMR